MYISHKSDNSASFDLLASLYTTDPVRTAESKGASPFTLKKIDLGAFYGD